jgi:hypothetical protein
VKAKVAAKYLAAAGLGVLAVLGAQGDLTPELDPPSPTARAIQDRLRNFDGWLVQDRLDYPPNDGDRFGTPQWLVLYVDDGGPKRRWERMAIYCGSRWCDVYIKKNSSQLVWQPVTMSYSDRVHVNRTACWAYETLKDSQVNELLIDLRTGAKR